MTFIKKDRTYLHFLAKVEKDEQLTVLLADQVFDRVLRWLSKMLPIKRPYEFALLKALLHEDSITLSEARKQVLKWVEEVPEVSLTHSMRTLNQEFFDSRERNEIPQIVEWDGSILRKTRLFVEVLSNDRMADFIYDVLEYGLFRYEREFGKNNYGIPHFKLYEQYTMVDTALLSNYEKSHSSFRGSGLVKNGHDYFLFIDLHKEADLDERIKYNDKLISRTQFQWETPNQTSQASQVGQNIIHNDKKGIHLHLFVRKYQEIEKNFREPYIYIGKGNTLSYKGNKPIEVQLELENRLPEQLFIELTEKV